MRVSLGFSDVAATVTTLLAQRRRIAMLWFAALVLMLAASILVSATVGAARIPVQVSAGVLLERLGVVTAWSAEASDSQRQIIWTIRLPRILLAAAVGASLAL